MPLLKNNILGWERETSDLDEGGGFFVPFDRSIFDRHCIWIGLELDAKVKLGGMFRKVFSEVFSKVGCSWWIR